MKKLAIIVQRAGTNIIGGSEDYALRMAKILSQQYSVDIITTTARDHTTWENYYHEGIENLSESLNIIRFSVDIGRNTFWYELHKIIFDYLPLNKFYKTEKNERTEFIKKIKKIPTGFQEEFIKFQGPYSRGLLNFLKIKKNYYNYFIFMTYLYAPTFFGIDIIENKNKVFVCPTFHDEPPAYLPVFRKYFDYKLLFLTKAEKKIAEKIFENDIKNFRIINFGLEDKYNCGKIAQDKFNQYIIYAGRLEEGKGIGMLFEQFEKFVQENPDVDLHLLLLGDGHLKTIRHPMIKYMGVVDENKKINLLKGALAFVHPSPLESLSIALIESFMVGTPAIVNKKSEVLFDHIRKSHAGFTYSSYREFSDALIKIIKDDNLRQELSKNARKYFMKEYNIKIYKEKLISILESEISKDTKNG